MKVAYAEDIRWLDETCGTDYGITELMLMENAGHRIAEAAEAMIGKVKKRRVLVLAGSGNNGGDALVAARHLTNAGACVKIFTVGERGHQTESTQRQQRIVEKMGIEVYVLEDERDWNQLRVAIKFSDVVLDGILGIGFSGELKKPVLRLIEILNEAKARVLSIDIPSGLEANTGRVGTVAVCAECTVSLALPKISHFFGGGPEYTGRLILDDIGIPYALLSDDRMHVELLTDEMMQTYYPQRAQNAHKGSCGKLLILAGSRAMTGAAALASMAALRVGAGLVTLAVPESQQRMLDNKLTEVMVQPIPEIDGGAGEAALEPLLKLLERQDALLIGPGLGRREETLVLVRTLALRADCPILLDADAIHAFKGCAASLAQCKHTPILTPHYGEMATLTGEPIESIEANPIQAAKKAAEEWNVILVLKGACTVIAYPQGKIFLSALGNSGMATAGCGDVLAGAIAGFFGQVEAEVSPLIGTYMHGMAGNFAEKEKGYGLIARDVLENLPKAGMRLKNTILEDECLMYKE